MIFVDCTWELDNIGKRTCEVTYDDKDIFNSSVLVDKIKGFEYIVVKIPMNHPEMNMGLSDLGFTMIETQLNISKCYKDFNFDDRLVKYLYPRVSDKLISTEKEILENIEKMTPDMFNSDRIYLDPNFPHNSSCKRYANWMRTEFKKEGCIIKRIYIDGIEIGFAMSREKNGISYGLLGGIYECEQSEGYGLLTACFGFITAKKNSSPFKKAVTTISSNNVPMVNLYNYLQFKIDSMRYVFVKHNN